MEQEVTGESQLNTYDPKRVVSFVRSINTVYQKESDSDASPVHSNGINDSDVDSLLDIYKKALVAKDYTTAVIEKTPKAMVGWLTGLPAGKAMMDAGLPTSQSIQGLKRQAAMLIARNLMEATTLVDVTRETLSPHETLSATSLEEAIILLYELGRVKQSAYLNPSEAQTMLLHFRLRAPEIAPSRETVDRNYHRLRARIEQQKLATSSFARYAPSYKFTHDETSRMYFRAAIDRRVTAAEIAAIDTIKTPSRRQEREAQINAQLTTGLLQLFDPLYD